MKCYINKDKKQDVKKIINEMLNDDEFWKLGITEMTDKLEQKGFTRKQAGIIQHKLQETVNRICKNI